MEDVEYGTREAVDDEQLSVLHALAFRHEIVTIPWNDRVTQHSLFWVTARRSNVLIGFVNVIGDGGAHAVLLDLCVHPQEQGRRIGQTLVRAVGDEARRRGCQWLHAYYEPQLTMFYQQHCGLRSTAAGLLAL